VHALPDPGRATWPRSRVALVLELRDRDVAVLLVEEKVREALDVADHVAVMRLGHITWSGARADADADRLAAAYLEVAEA